MNISVHLFNGAYFNKVIVLSRSDLGMIASLLPCIVMSDKSIPKFGIELRKSNLSSLIYAPVVTVVIFFVGKYSDAILIKSYI